MTDDRVPQAEHVQFDALCEGLDEYDALPSLGRSPASPANETADSDEDGSSERLDEQILAALISP